MLLRFGQSLRSRVPVCLVLALLCAAEHNGSRECYKVFYTTEQLRHRYLVDGLFDGYMSSQLENVSSNQSVCCSVIQ